MLTKSLHRDLYPAIDPKNNSVQGKVVVITGAAGGLGYGIALVGRNAESLEKVAKDIVHPTQVITIAADVVSVAACEDIFKKAVAQFGRVDALVNTAGTTNVDAIGQIDPKVWWANFVRTYNMILAFINAIGGKGTAINLVSLGAWIVRGPGLSGYSASKLAVIKLGECLDLEQPDIRVFSVHPGMVEAEDGRGIVVDAFTPFAKDKAALTGGLTTYLAQPRADFLKGTYIHANWDVNELEAHKTELVEKGVNKPSFLKAELRLGGYPGANNLTDVMSMRFILPHRNHI
ncbi:hypothetical protein B0T10DRAFT_418474 [Thelonectria olida]|uniref:NAD(P)-binding protein n=1 Tax=Thelonectria olida TaxID=1576542 RepID=A0A9P8VPI9_9HYPO|nr:hypothetical protein B0T10DRAFT_418474 [Thelonectria olida]